MSSKFTIAGNSIQINFRYKCLQNFTTKTTNGENHEFKQNTILRIDDFGDNYAILTYTTFPAKEKIQICIYSDFEHIEKLSGFST